MTAESERIVLEHRIERAHAMANVLDGVITHDVAKGFNADGQSVVADLAGLTKPPSEATWLLVVAFLRQRETARARVPAYVGEAYTAEALG